MVWLCRRVVSSEFTSFDIGDPSTDTDPSLSNVASDLIFNVPKIVSFLSQGTTLKSGTIILTG